MRRVASGPRLRLPACHAQEYGAVLAGWSLLAPGVSVASSSGSGGLHLPAAAGVVRHEGLGVAVVRVPRPLHYYSLFSFAEPGCDVVVTLMDGQRYEVECR